ncbi:NAD(P)-dependent oxidoreductase, partial [Candidatus Woesebacteria bacterium]
MELKNVGWIGTGVMGKSMCTHILNAGHTVYVYNRTKQKAAFLIENGAFWCESPEEV